MRTFIAIELDDAIRQRLGAAQERLRGSAGGVKWVEPSRIHLTLKFLGEIGEDAVDSVADAMEAAARGVEPFPIRVAGIGSFPPRGAPRVIWAGVEDPTGRLAVLHGLIDRGLEPLGFERETRSFSPHVTLGRVKKRRGGPRLRSPLAGEPSEDFGAQEVDDLVLFRSILSSAGPTYTPLRCLRLGQSS